MTGARETHAALDEPWRVAMDEAWRSWVGGSAGIGAVIAAPDGQIVAVGRNRMVEPRVEPGVPASTGIAHAEVNALAVLPLGTPGALTITTTFEPCLMCAAAVVQARVARVRFAATDPVFDGLHDWFAELPFARDRLPVREELGGRIGAFAHVLHATWLAFWLPEGDVMDAHQRLRPRHLAVARDLAAGGGLADVATGGGDVVDALTVLWDTLGDLAVEA